MGTSCELKDRAYLNKGELPLPENADGKTRADLGLPGDLWDLNQDGIQKGVFNVEDYINDPRVKSAVAGLHKSPAGGTCLHHLPAHNLTRIPVHHGGPAPPPHGPPTPFRHHQTRQHTAPATG